MKPQLPRRVSLKAGFLGILLTLPLIIDSACRNSDSRLADLPEVKSTVDRNTAFAIEVFHKLGQRSGNLVFSPYSLSVSLGMTYAGARGLTQREMAQVLHFELPKGDLDTAFDALGLTMERSQARNSVTLGYGEFALVQTGLSAYAGCSHFGRNTISSKCWLRGLQTQC